MWLRNGGADQKWGRGVGEGGCTGRGTTGGLGEDSSTICTQRRFVPYTVSLRINFVGINNNWSRKDRKTAKKMTVPTWQRVQQTAEKGK